MTENDINEQLDRDGYVILKNVVSAEHVEKLRADITAMVSSYASENESVFDTINRLDRDNKADLYRIYQFISKTFTAMDNIRADVMPLLEQILPAGTVIDLGSAVIFGIPDNDRLTWQWHQEAPYDPEIKNILSVNMPIFEAATIANGTISLLKGSHKLGPLPFKRVQDADDASTSLIPEGIDDFAEDYEEAFFLAEPGDIILFFENLIHRSNRNTTTRPRITFVGRFASISALPEHATIVDGKPY